MLYRAAEPDRRYRVLEHFYRLPEPLIGRFYAGRPTWRDKIRVLSGRPPVPVGRALRAVLTPGPRPAAAVSDTGGRD
jgi:lycopene beta-cyclase